MFKICMFDLDDTLVRTDDLKDVREACKNNEGRESLQAVKVALTERQGRHIYSLELLRNIRKKYPELKLGVFTRSPRSYANTVLAWAYPSFAWDVLVAYEDVRPTKPYGDGIDLAMGKFEVKHLDRVMLVGDTDVDVRAAYNCGCIAILDRSSWPARNKRPEHWRALEYVPDAIIDSPEELLQVLSRPVGFLPELERLLAEESQDAANVRFDRVNHFVPQTVGGDTTAFPVYVCGRSFAQYKSLRFRRQWHTLTLSIEEHKEADEFSQSWIDALRTFIVDQYPASFGPVSILVTTVPHRPGRKARLETLLRQLQESVNHKRIKNRDITVVPELLKFKDGVKSQHNDYLNRDQRFENVRDHLFVQAPKLVERGKSILILDDVVTTGASLIYAITYLKAAGARDVRGLAMAKSIGDVL